MSNFIVCYAPEAVVTVAIERDLSIPDVFARGLLDAFIEETEIKLNCSFCGLAADQGATKFLFRRNKKERALITTITGLMVGIKFSENIVQLDEHLKRSDFAYQICSPSQLEMIDGLIKRTKKNYEVKP